MDTDALHELEEAALSLLTRNRFYGDRAIGDLWPVYAQLAEEIPEGMADESGLSVLRDAIERNEAADRQYADVDHSEVSAAVTAVRRWLERS